MILMNILSVFRGPYLYDAPFIDETGSAKLTNPQELFRTSLFCLYPDQG